MQKLLTIVLCALVLCGSAATQSLAADFDKSDLTITSGVKYDTLYKVLKTKKIEKHTQAFIDAEETYGVNAFVLIAIGALESGWYTTPCGRNNYHGQVGLNFNSAYDGIQNAAKNLSTNYLNTNGCWYKGKATKSIASTWCPTDTIQWIEDVNWIAADLTTLYNSY